MKPKKMHSILLKHIHAHRRPERARACCRTGCQTTVCQHGQFLMDRNPEIAKARSAAPDAISRDATVLVLGRAWPRNRAVEEKNGTSEPACARLLGNRSQGFGYATHFVLEKVAIQHRRKVSGLQADSVRTGIPIQLSEFLF